MKNWDARKLLTSIISVALLLSSATVTISANGTREVNVSSTPELSPVPKKVTYLGGVVNVTDTVNIVGKDTADQDAVHDLRLFLHSKNLTVNDSFVPESTTFYIGEEGDNNPDMNTIKNALGMKNTSQLGEEGYVLKTDSLKGGSIVLEGSSGDGTFYAIQTLKQLFKGKSIPETYIEDEPTMKTRGTIEGFYGTPWSHQDRLNQIDFYGDMKLNTYIYAPKDDPYHREHWRDLYDSASMAKMEELIQKAKENKVDFVFSLSPGLDIKFDGDAGEADYQALVAKCQQLYDKGVRSYAIFFDDIKNKDGAKQAALLNRFNKQFIQGHKGIKPLITVPTEYDSLAMGVGSTINQYTKDFSDNLDPSIMVLYTGSSVVPEGIDTNNIQQVKQVYGNRMGIWWNYPCNDYIQDKLGLGPIYGLDKGLRNEVDMLVMNPMEHAELSKIALTTGADYSWNTEAYDDEQSFKTAIDILYGDLAPAMYTFANHSSRLVAGWASTGRADAPKIRTLMDSTMKNVAKGIDASEGIAALHTEFDNMIQAADTLKGKLPSNEVSHCLANLEKLKALGEYDKIALTLFLEKNKDQPDQARINELTAQINTALPSLKSGKKVSELTGLSFITEVLDYAIEPTADFSVSSTFATPGTNIQLTNQSSLSSTELEWHAPGADISSITGERTVITYPKEGIYTVSLIAKNKHGKDTLVKKDMITISNSANEEKRNLALHKTATASGQTAASEAPDKAIDGITTTKWCTTNGGKQWIEIDLGSQMTITDIAIGHAGSGGEGSSLNTKAYRIEISSNHTQYKEVVNVQNNTASLTNDAIPATVGRYVKLYIDNPTQGGDRAARIYEINVNGLPHSITLPPVYTGADKGFLAAKIAEASKYAENTYTGDSYQALTSAIQAAQVLINDEGATQEAVNQSVATLTDAIHGLKERAADSDIQNIKDVIIRLKAMENNVSKEAFKEAKALLISTDALLAKGDKNIEKNEAQLVYTKLLQAESQLQVVMNKETLTNLVMNAEKITHENYTVASIQTLKEKIANAKIVLAKDATAEELKAAYTALGDAIGRLVELGDKTALRQIMDTASTILSNRDRYVPSSLKGLQEAYNNANAIYKKDEALKNEVDAVIKKLKAELNEIREQADYSKVDAAIEQAKKLNAKDYDNFNTVQKAIHAVVRNLDASKQDEVNAMARNIQAAIEGLKKTSTIDTGDTSNVITLCMLGLAGLAAMCFIMIQKKAKAE